MEENLRIPRWLPFAMNKAHIKSSLHPRHHNKMECCKKKYILVVVDDFTRYTWVVLLKDKAEASEKMIHLCKKLQVEKDTVVARIRSDHGREFENTKLATFCNEQGTHQ